MKRWFLLLLCSVLLLSGAGCRSREAAIVYTDISTEYAMGNISVTYPRLAGQLEGSKIPAVNYLIKTNILERVFDDSLYALHQVVADIDYTITLQNQSVISLLYTGTLKASPEEEPRNMVYTATFDLINGKEIPFSQIAANLEELTAQMAAAPLVANATPDEQKLESYRPQMDRDALIEQYEQNTQYTFHLTDGGLCLSFPVPHDLGDYALITVPCQYGQSN